MSGLVEDDNVHAVHDTETGEESFRERIRFILTICPRLTPSMLQIGVGPHNPPRIWRPVLDKMVKEGVVSKEDMNLTTPIGQFRTITVLSLSNPEPLERMMARYAQTGVPTAV